MKLHSKELLYGLSEFYKIFGDQTRLRILDALLNKPLCVNEISELLDMTQSAISHQLKNLRTSNLVIDFLLLATAASDKYSPVSNKSITITASI